MYFIYDIMYCRMYSFNLHNINNLNLNEKDLNLHIKKRKNQQLQKKKKKKKSGNYIKVPFKISKIF